MMVPVRVTADYGQTLDISDPESAAIETEHDNPSGLTVVNISGFSQIFDDKMN